VATDGGLLGVLEVLNKSHGAFDQVDEALIEAFQKQIIPLYQREGVQLRGTFVAEMSENEFPRLPAFQNENELVVITASPTEEIGQATHARLAPIIAQTFGASLDGAPESLLLTPTLRSPLRYQSDFLDS